MLANNRGMARLFRLVLQELKPGVAQFLVFGALGRRRGGAVGLEDGNFGSSGSP